MIGVRGRGGCPRGLAVLLKRGTRVPRGGSCSAGSNRFSMNMSSCCLCCGRFWPASARRGSAHKRPSGRASVECSRASLEITWAMTTLTALTSGVRAITCCSCLMAGTLRPFGCRRRRPRLIQTGTTSERVGPRGWRPRPEAQRTVGAGPRSSREQGRRRKRVRHSATRPAEATA